MMQYYLKCVSSIGLLARQWFLVEYHKSLNLILIDSTLLFCFLQGQDVQIKPIHRILYQFINGRKTIPLWIIKFLNVLLNWLLVVLLREAPTLKLEIWILILQFLDLLQLLGNLLNGLRYHLRILNCGLGAISAVGATQLRLDLFGRRLLLHHRLLLLLGLNVNNFVIVTHQPTDDLVLRHFNCAFSLKVLVGSFNNLVSDGLLHQINLTLPNDFHQLVLQWDLNFLIPLVLVLILIPSSYPLDPCCASSLRYHGILACFDRGVHEEWVIFMREVEVFAEVWLVEHSRSVGFHF